MSESKPEVSYAEQPRWKRLVGSVTWCLETAYNEDKEHDFGYSESQYAATLVDMLRKWPGGDSSDHIVDCLHSMNHLIDVALNHLYTVDREKLGTRRKPFRQ
jgi:hypothetical protein